MMFARQRNCLMAHFSKRIPVVKWRISVPVSPADFADLKRR